MPRDASSASTRRSFLRFVGAASATTTVAGCLGESDGVEAESDGTDDGTVDEDRGVSRQDVDGVRITQPTFPLTLDPVDHNDTPTWNVVDQAYEPLLNRDGETGEPVELLATAWERIDDQRVELEIRDDVAFHNGDEMTTEDVAFSINRTNDPDESVQAGVIGAIEEARAEDGSVVIDLERAEPTIFRNLTAFGRIQQKEWVEERDDELATEMNGTGPYELAEFAEEAVEFTRFDDYWNGAPAVEEATFDAVLDEEARVDRLVAGETDLIVDARPADVATLDGEDGLAFEFVPSSRSIFVVMPNDDDPFDSQHFRRAMNYAVDTRSIIDGVLNEFGERTSQPSLPMQFGYAEDVEPYPFDPERAEELVEESGYGGIDVTIDTPTGRYLHDVEIAETVAGQIDDLENVSASVERRETESLFDEIATGEISDSPDSFLIGWENPTFDANYTLESWFAAGAFHHFEDDEIEDMIVDANGETDEDTREAILQDVNRELHDLAPWIFLYQQYTIYGVDEALEWDARTDETVLVEEIEYA